MRTRIIRIGNSQGIRIPKAVLQQAQLGGEVDLTVVGSEVILRRVGPVREGWEAAFEEMATHGDDRLLDAETGSLTTWDDTEWEW